MSAMSNYLENKIVDWLYRGQTFTPPATRYFALFTAAPSDAGGVAVTAALGKNLHILSRTIPVIANKATARVLTRSTTIPVRAVKTSENRVSLYSKKTIRCRAGE